MATHAPVAVPQAPSAMARWMYDVVLKVFASMVDIFFREIQVRGAWRVPANGPIILVAGPHANQVRIHSVMSQSRSQKPSTNQSCTTSLWTQ
jgi:1-acyl-sn-glycerol-3-phosphate acyltransferase